jgi:polyhydroxyalkanoate synthase
MWSNSAAAWPSLKAAWHNSKAERSPTGQSQADQNQADQAALVNLTRLLASLDGELQKADEGALIAALAAEGHRRLESFVDGVSAYRHHPYRRDLADRPVLWRDGTTLLRDYRRAADAKAPRVLVIPSLIIRFYILDLTAESSFLADLAQRGYAPFVVDWDAPGLVEQRFDLTRYIAGRLEGALDAVRREPGGPIIVVGYCMGGMLALALALRRQKDIDGLVCLATPWDFHAEAKAQSQLIGEMGKRFDPIFQVLGEMPVDLLQSFFAALDPLALLAKFRRFGQLDPDSDQAAKFVALEDWLNDGVPLPAPVARECVIGWYGNNTPGRGEWQVAGRAIRPAEVEVPTLVVVPDQDRIVPPASALVLGRDIPGATTMTVPLGHIGMVSSGRATDELWQRLAGWLAGEGAGRHNAQRGSANEP